jgi:uncharacterized membrane protein
MINEAAADSRGSHVDVPYARATPARPGASPRAGRRALQAAAASWFVVAALGQAMFAFYVIAAYGSSIVLGRWAQWNRFFPRGHGYIPGDAPGNLALGFHLSLVAVVMLGGVVQLIPGLRRRWPALHRWTGRIYLASVVTVSVGGLILNLTREPIGTPAQNLATRINALLILGFAALAFQRARSGRIDLHRRWALRLFLAASGVWFIRLMWWLWAVVVRGLGYDPEMFDGSFTVMNFAQFLLPLLVLELYFRAQDRGGPWRRIAMAATLGGLTVAMAVAIAAVTLRLWLPRLSA